MKDISAIILAAGDGKRMKSKYPKATCQVLFKPMISWVMDWCKKSGIDNICVVVGEEYQSVLDCIDHENIEIVHQIKRLGTGHAVRMAKNFIDKNKESDIIVLYADAPFIDDEIITNSLKAHRQSGSYMTVITSDVIESTGYGRIIRKNETLDSGKLNQENVVLEIVEQKDATYEQQQIKEINSGTYWFRGDFLFESIELIDDNNSQKEYYLTDTAKIASRQGKKVTAFKTKDSRAVLGANDRRSLLALNEIARQMVIDRLLDDGVEFVSTDGVVVGHDVIIGSDTKILPSTIIKGKTNIGNDCTIGPNTLIDNSNVGDECSVVSSQILFSSIGNKVNIGPNSQIRPNSQILDGVKVGNFVEIKNSTIGEKSSVAHLTYIGDSDIGKRVNVGCGVVTVNYDGYKKYRTTVGDDVFIGCNTNLVAPITLNNSSYTAAGSTITDNVESGSLAIARARQSNKLNWVKAFKSKFV